MAECKNLQVSSEIVRLEMRGVPTWQCKDSIQQFLDTCAGWYFSTAFTLLKF